MTVDVRLWGTLSCIDEPSRKSQVSAAVGNKTVVDAKAMPNVDQVTGLMRELHFKGERFTPSTL
jgi:hypothetical protein